MTNRERVIASLNHKQPDKTPYNIGFTVPARRKMTEFYGDPDFDSKLGNCFSFLSCSPADAWREVRPNLWEDHFGVQWDRSIDKDIGVVANRLVTPDNVDTLELPDPANPAIWGAFPSPTSRGADEFVVANLGFSLFERAWTLAGMDHLLMAMVADPDFANRLLDRILEYNLDIIEQACSYAIDAMMFGDDWGSQRGLIMGPDLWHEFIGPRVREMYQAVKKHNKYVFIHSCGKVDELFPKLIEYGLDVFNPFQPEVVDVYAAKRNVGDRLSFYGGISTQRTLPYASLQETRDEVRRLIESIGKDGGFFASPAHDIPSDAKPENVAAMLDVLQNQ